MSRHLGRRWKEFVPAGASPAVDKALKIKGRLGLKCLKRGELQGSRCRELRDACHRPPSSWLFSLHSVQWKKSRGTRTSSATATTTSSSARRTSPTPSPTSRPGVPSGSCACHTGGGAQRRLSGFGLVSYGVEFGRLQAIEMHFRGFWLANAYRAQLEPFTPGSARHAPRAPGASDPSDPSRGKRLRRPQVMRRGHHAPRLR